MIISRTPLRISFLGGGTDYPTWYHQHGGAVLSTAINHYCYLSCRYLPPFFQHKSRVLWRKVEQVEDNSAIDHPAVNAALRYLDITEGVEVAYQGDLPARSGLGSSSAFTVGLLHGLYGLKGMMSSKRALASEAIHIERDLIKENVGLQDQIATAYGGLNHITIDKEGHFQVAPFMLSQRRLEELQTHLLLFFTGVSRTASHIAGDKIKAIPRKEKEMQRIHALVDEGIQILTGNDAIDGFGTLIHEHWLLKRGLTKGIAPTFIDTIYERAQKAGAIGGKVLGAGGGGFMLFFAKPEKHIAVMNALSDLLLVPFEFDTNGSQIIFYDNVQYSHMAMERRDFMHLNNQKGKLSATESNSEIHANEKVAYECE